MLISSTYSSQVLYKALDIVCAPGSIIFLFLRFANSHHHQAIKDIASVLRASAYSEDGIIEAIEGTDTAGYMIGVQCHPESLLVVEPKWELLFRSFVVRSNDSKLLLTK